MIKNRMLVFSLTSILFVGCFEHLDEVSVLDVEIERHMEKRMFLAGKVSQLYWKIKTPSGIHMGDGT